jgi:hypothetical protein
MDDELREALAMSAEELHTMRVSARQVPVAQADPPAFGVIVAEGSSSAVVVESVRLESVRVQSPDELTIR